MPDHASASAARPLSPARRPRPAVSRRAAMTGAGMGLAALLAGCGGLRLGSPVEHTPPPEGIDDLYRADLLARLEDLLATTGGDTGDLARSRPEVAGHVRELHAALVEHRRAMLTGAEAEAASESAGTASSASGSTSPADPSAGSAPDLVGLLAALGETVALGADACVQCSGSFARVTGAIAAHLCWAAHRVAAGAPDLALTATPPPPEQGIQPQREVPASDPPSVAAASDHEAALRRAQEDEWYAAYVQEVRAARSTDAAVREALVTEVAAHRARADRLASTAVEDGVSPLPQEPVYPLPEGGLVDEALDSLPVRIAEALVVDWVALTGAAPFARRAFAISTALTESADLARTGGALPALPSLDPTSG